MGFNVVAIGELLWDLLPSGKQLGGAPANFAYHAGALGASATLVSRVGVDALGDEAIALLQSRGVSVDCVQRDADAPTGSVSVTLDPRGEPRYVIHENVAWDRLEASEPARRAVASAHAVCFGSLAQRSAISRATIDTLISGAGATRLRIFDVNLRQHYYSRELLEASFAQANVVKLNDVELETLAELLALPQGVEARLEQLARRYDLRVIALTRGAQGSLLMGCGPMTGGDRIHAHPGIPTRVIDTIGAGDAFTAALAVGLLSDWPLDQINAHANHVASYVASKAGGMPALPTEITEAFKGVAR